MNRYMTPLDEDELFEWGATAFRMDIASYRDIQGTLDNATWSRPDDIPSDLPGYIPEKPMGQLDKSHLDKLTHALNTMVNDPSLAPNIVRMGHFSVSGLELQNGSYDDNWHHDGLAGKRHGHAGDFFLLAYFGNTTWDPTWGGQFEYAKRTLGDDWSLDGFTPISEVRHVLPSTRTVVLGWNQNPRLIHRAAPLNAAADRVTLIASLDFHPR